MYSITVDQPNLSEGAEVEIDGLGIYANGGTYHVTDEESVNFTVRHGGLLLEDATIYGVTVSPVDLAGDEGYASWNKADLVAETDKRGLSHAGTKADLVARLLEADDKEEGEND